MNRKTTRRSAQMLGVLALVLMILPTVLEAQQQRARRQGGRMMGSSVAFLIEKASDLGLTDAQTEQLTSLQTQFEEDSAALRTRMEEGRANRDRDAMQSMMQEYRGIDLALVEKAMPLLDEGQREKAKALLDERRSNRRRPRGG